MVFISGIILLCLFAEPFFNGVDTMLSGTSYEGSVAQFQEDDGVNPIRVAFYSLFPILEFWKKDELAEYYFVKSGQSQLVNLRHVNAVRKEEVQIGTEWLKISRSRKKAFLEELADYMEGGGR